MTSKGCSLYRRASDTRQSPLVGEGYLLELISAGAPLPQILNRLCAAVDLQVGNVVSLVLFPDDEEHSAHLIARSAAQFGLFAFCCITILSRSEELLGTFEMYCCFPRNPTSSENRLIDRATHLAALAIQKHNQEQDSMSFSLLEGSAIGRSSSEGPPFRN
jgi:GAF domain-containing protein